MAKNKVVCKTLIHAILFKTEGNWSIKAFAFTSATCKLLSPSFPTNHLKNGKAAMGI
jgi:hypothetical protein